MFKGVFPLLREGEGQGEGAKDSYPELAYRLRQVLPLTSYPLPQGERREIDAGFGPTFPRPLGERVRVRGNLLKHSCKDLNVGAVGANMTTIFLR